MNSIVCGGGDITLFATTFVFIQPNHPCSIACPDARDDNDDHDFDDCDDDDDDDDGGYDGVRRIYQRRICQ